MDDSTTVCAKRVSPGEKDRRERAPSRCLAFQMPYWSSCPHAFRPSPTPFWYSFKSCCAFLRSLEDARRVKGDVIEAKCRTRPTARGADQMSGGI